MTIQFEPPHTINKAPLAAVLRLVVMTAFLVFVVVCTGCGAPRDVGSVEIIKGGFLADAQITRVADLMARDMVREPIFYNASTPPRIAFVKVENDTSQYLFDRAKEAFIVRMRTQLARALGGRVKFLDEDAQNALRDELTDWHPEEPASRDLAAGRRDRHGVDYLLVARFMSTDKVVQIPDKDGDVNNRRIVQLQLAFSLVDAESAEIAWTNTVSSAAAFTTRDFQN